jgi:hypothetical protein
MAVLGRDGDGAGAEETRLLFDLESIRESLKERRMEDARAAEMGFFESGCSKSSTPWETGMLLGTVLLNSTNNE